jgi:glycosyltransferase involved in cell wall biosynthesis
MHEGALVGYLLSRISRVPLVFDFQGSLTGEMVDHGFLSQDGPWYRWVRLLERRIDLLPDAIVTSTGRAAELLECEFNCRHERVIPLPDSVDVERFRPDVVDVQEIAGRKAALGIPRDRPVVVYLGLLANYQGTPLLVDAARELKERGFDVHFLVMGFPGESEYRRLVGEMGLADRVTFTGKVPYEEAPAHLALGDIAVAPKLSETEGAGKILNYMAMALPTVAFDDPVSREYLADLGVYADPAGGATALADAVASLVDLPERRAALGRELRAFARRRFSWDNAGHTLVGVYRCLLGSRV